VCPFCVTTGLSCHREYSTASTRGRRGGELVEGTVLYAVSHTSGGYHVCRYYVAEWGQIPFWACVLSVRRQASAVWQVLTHDASDTPLLTLSIVTCSQRRHFRLVAYPLSPLALRLPVLSLPKDLMASLPP